jgi:hypothetical protein
MRKFVVGFMLIMLADPVSGCFFEPEPYRGGGEDREGRGGDAGLGDRR